MIPRAPRIRRKDAESAPKPRVTGRSTRHRAFSRDAIIIDGVTYMKRYHLISNRLFGIRVHHIVRPDPGRDLHDHPFNFMSIVLRGKYRELLDDGRRVNHYVGVPHFRRAETAHLISEVSSGGTWTLVFRSRIRRDWGFLMNGNWVWHRNYEAEGGLV